ncbi:LysR family transcriptional regulator [Paenibacillus daejeonensis]|uniref:LysR family transcriptional regulator n=1 Tax=Paenibacillus daejeonensis TaxID=135193 RepID=UPI00035F36EC|nr:LysR family transcriptional regulator [Paenibacillus daejeonensis]
MLEQMHIFATVVEQSSLNKASALLNVSQPALSRKIAKLEEELDVELFRRVGKRLELTSVGQLTYAFAKELRALELNYMQSVAEYRHTERRQLTIGASLTTLQTTLPDLIQVLTRVSPELEIKAVTGKTHEIVSLVRDKRADMGLVASIIDESHLNCVPLFEDQLQLVLPRNLLVTDKSVPEISILNGLPMILFSKGTWYRVLTDELFQTFRLSPDVRMEIDSFEAILRLLHTCRAATLLPQSYLRAQLLEDNDLMLLPIRELAQARRTTTLIYSPDDQQNGASMRLWLDEIKTHFTRKGSR